MHRLVSPSRPEFSLGTCSCTVGKKEASFSVTIGNEVQFTMNIGNEELMQECFPKHLHMGTARMKYDREREEDKKRCVSMERSRAGTKI